MSKTWKYPVGLKVKVNRRMVCVDTYMRDRERSMWGPGTQCWPVATWAGVLGHHPRSRPFHPYHPHWCRSNSSSIKLIGSRFAIQTNCYFSFSLCEQHSSTIFFVQNNRYWSFNSHLQFLNFLTLIQHPACVFQSLFFTQAFSENENRETLLKSHYFTWISEFGNFIDDFFQQFGNVQLVVEFKWKSKKVISVTVFFCYPSTCNILTLYQSPICIENIFILWTLRNYFKMKLQVFQEICDKFKQFEMKFFHF